MRAEYERKYTNAGRVAHLLPMGDATSPLCGRVHQPSHWWLGTGSQDEYDRAAVMPTCKRCERSFVTIAALNYGSGNGGVL